MTFLLTSACIHPETTYHKPTPKNVELVKGLCGFVKEDLYCCVMQSGFEKLLVNCTEK